VTYHPRNLRDAGHCSYTTENTRRTFNTLRKGSYVPASNQILCRHGRLKSWPWGNVLGSFFFVCLSVLPLCFELLWGKWRLFCCSSGTQFDRTVAWYGTTNLKLTVKCEGYLRQYGDPGGCMFEFKVRLTTREWKISNFEFLRCGRIFFFKPKSFQGVLRRLFYLGNNWIWFYDLIYNPFPEDSCF